MRNDFALMFYLDGTEQPDSSGHPTIRGFCGQREQVLDRVKNKPAVWDWSLNGPFPASWVVDFRARLQMEAVR